jgi:hypothetical protein
MNEKQTYTNPMTNDDFSQIDFGPVSAQKSETPRSTGAMLDHRELSYGLCVPFEVSRDLEKDLNRLEEERKTVHQWLDLKGTQDTEATGLKMCLLRRLAIALGVQPHVCANAELRHGGDEWNTATNAERNTAGLNTEPILLLAQTSDAHFLSRTLFRGANENENQ